MDRVRPPLGAAFLRLLTVQGSWNYERLVGVGMGVAEEPLLRDLRDGGDGGGAAYRAAVARGARFFNAHPYLCGLAVGATARAEHEGTAPDKIERFRSALCGPLGSLGDRLFWAGWLPLGAVGAIGAVTLGAGWVAVVAFLFLYNLGHLTLRWWALAAGWNAGTDVAGALRHPLLQRSLAIVLPAMALTVGGVLPLATRWLAEPLPVWLVPIVLAVAAAGAVVLRRWKKQVTGPRLGLAVIGLAVLVGALWR